MGDSGKNQRWGREQAGSQAPIIATTLTSTIPNTSVERATFLILFSSMVLSHYQFNPTIMAYLKGCNNVVTYAAKCFEHLKDATEMLGMFIVCCPEVDGGIRPYRKLGLLHS